MNKELKISLIVAAIIITLIFVGGHFALKFFGEAFGTNCEKSKSWAVGEYKIQEYKCIGWAGPYYYQLHLYKNEEEITENGIKLDSCTVRFKIRNDLYLKLNYCNNQETELKPKKILLDIKKVDSVLMINVELNQYKKLQIENVKNFVQKWNNAPAFSIRDSEKPYYPNSSYFIKVYTNDSIREFETGSFLINDNEKWVYSFLDPKENIGENKFDEMWNEIKTTANQVERR